MATSIPFDERINLAAELIIRAKIFYDIWWFYTEKESLARNLYTMNCYTPFFQFDSHAHFVSLVVHLAMLFEHRENNDTINFETLFTEAIASDSLTPENIRIGREKLDEIQQLYSKLVILRSNLFAHRSASVSYEDAFKKAGITGNQLRDITEKGLQIANLLLLARGLSEQFFYTPPRRQIEALFCDLAKSKEQC